MVWNSRFIPQVTKVLFWSNPSTNDAPTAPFFMRNGMGDGVKVGVKVAVLVGVLVAVGTAVFAGGPAGVAVLTGAGVFVGGTSVAVGRLSARSPKLTGIFLVIPPITKVSNSLASVSPLMVTVQVPPAGIVALQVVFFVNAVPVKVMELTVIELRDVFFRVMTWSSPGRVNSTAVREMVSA